MSRTLAALQTNQQPITEQQPIQHSIWQRWKRILKIIIGTGLLAFSVKCIFDPCGMVVGGFSGVAIIVKELTSDWIEGGIPLGITTLALNIPVFCVAFPVRGKEFVGRTLLATVLLSMWLELLPFVRVAEQDFVLAAVFGGLTGGAGIGLVLSTGTTTGGTDMLGSILQLKLTGFTVAQIMGVLDGIIIIAGAFLFGFPSALYALVAVYVTAKTTDMLVVGLGYARSVYIITDKPEAVAERVFEQVDRGITSIYAKGMYTGNEKTILFCVVTKKEIVRLKECIYIIDPEAFVIVTEAKEVHGEGFRHNEQNKIG